MTNLDPSSLPAIRNDHEYIKTRARLSRKSEPSWLLRVLMNTFESYRQARKIGWSRPWNKVGTRTFLSLKLIPDREHAIMLLAHAALQEENRRIPEAALAYCDDLLSDANLMCFVFCSEVVQDNKLHESITLSFGRVSDLSHRHRDRLDMIFDAPVVENVGRGLARVRIIVDPYNRQKEPMCNLEISQPREQAHRAFLALAQFIGEKSHDERYVWQHWTNQYIDYFGERRWHPVASIFGPHVGRERPPMPEIDQLAA